MTRDQVTYGEKTCCLTSAEGFELSAPIVVLGELWDVGAMMLELEEVGAHGLAGRGTLATSLSTIGGRVEPLQSYRDVA